MEGDVHVQVAQQRQVLQAMQHTASSQASKFQSELQSTSVHKMKRLGKSDTCCALWKAGDELTDGKGMTDCIQAWADTDKRRFCAAERLVVQPAHMMQIVL